MKQNIQVPPVNDPDLARLEKLAYSLDAKFRFPGTNFRFGWDSIIGLVPGIGDTITLAPSVWMIWRGYKRGIRKRALLRMSLNSGADFVLGAIPLVGDAADLFLKANLRNVDIISKEIKRTLA